MKELKRDVDARYYDIESLKNVFLLSVYTPPKCCDVAGKVWNTGHIDAYVINDSDIDVFSTDFRKKAAHLLREENKNFTGSVALWNLNEAGSMIRLAKTFGVCYQHFINSMPERRPDLVPFRITCDTDPDYEEAYKLGMAPYLMGYNSTEYDNTMLAYLFFRSIIRSKGAIFIDGRLIDEEGEPFNPYDQASQKYADAKDLNEYVCPVSADEMRRLNDVLFSSAYHDSMHTAVRYNTIPDMRMAGEGLKTMHGAQSSAYTIWKNFRMSGRYVDVAKLPGKQTYLALKRLLAMLGYQIKESDNLDDTKAEIENEEQMLDLIAYNASDVVNLELLFYTDTYHAPFELKKGLLNTYKELVYEAKDSSFNRRDTVMPEKREGTFDEDHHAYEGYAPFVSPNHVRPDRINIDDTSARFATRTLCPYGRFKDAEYVSFLYPAKEEAEALGIEQRDVLDETLEFVNTRFAGDKFANARKSFQYIYDYYSSFRGKNFNDSKSYKEDYGEVPVSNVRDIPAGHNCIPYFDPDGKPTTCYANFSLGGIHGAELNMKRYLSDLEKYKVAVDAYNVLKKKVDYLKENYPDANAFFARRKDKDGRAIRGPEGENMAVMPDGTMICASEIPSTGSVQKGTKQYKDPVLTAKEPSLFELIDSKNPDRGWKLKDRYVFTSASLVNHDDFKSYYPNLLRHMRAFWNNGLGYDRYGVIYNLKEKYGPLIKSPETSPEDKAKYTILRGGTKLILNSVSGAADASFENAVRMNNRIISMRIIGQLFTWRIAQAQTLKGARVISTNTDGLYSVLDAEISDKALAEESKTIGVDIEPERMYLISKDSNNRIECDSSDLKDMTITASGGGSVGCRKGPNLSKSIDHPALIDWALSEYLVWMAEHGMSDLYEPFNREIGLKILNKGIEGACIPNDRMSKEAMVLVMAQMVASSSPSTYAWVFNFDTAFDPLMSGDDEAALSDIQNPQIMQRFNRVFFMDCSYTGDTVHLAKATAAVYHPEAGKRANGLVLEKPVMNALADAGSLFCEQRRGTAIKLKVSATDKKGKEIIECKKVYDSAQGASEKKAALEKLANAIDEKFSAGIDNSDAVKLIAEYGESIEDIRKKDLSRVAKIQKISKINPAWHAHIENHNLDELTDAEKKELIDHLDRQAYLQMLEDTYENSWRNAE